MEFTKMRVLTIAFQCGIADSSSVVHRKRYVFRLRQVQHSLKQQIPRMVKHDDVANRESPANTSTSLNVDRFFVLLYSIAHREHNYRRQKSR